MSARCSSATGKGKELPPSLAKVAGEGSPAALWPQALPLLLLLLRRSGGVKVLAAALWPQLLLFTPQALPLARD